MSHDVPLFISTGWRSASFTPPIEFSELSQTTGLKGLGVNPWLPAIEIFEIYSGCAYLYNVLRWKIHFFDKSFRLMGFEIILFIFAFSTRVNKYKVCQFIHLIFQDIDLQGFQKFLDCFLEVSTPEDLSRHIFQAFVHPPSQADMKGGALQVCQLLLIIMIGKLLLCFCIGIWYQ